MVMREHYVHAPPYEPEVYKCGVPASIAGSGRANGVYLQHPYWNEIKWVELWLFCSHICDGKYGANVNERCDGKYRAENVHMAGE